MAMESPEELIELAIVALLTLFMGSVILPVSKPIINMVLMVASIPGVIIGRIYSFIPVWLR